tara:strand:- start:444 stop:920 length:477 start_codon:yes stop_codon:yes gene_type:complete
MDPLSLVALASSSFKGVQILVNKGAEIEQVAKQLGKWFSYASDIREAEKEAENPPIFKKIFSGNSVEEEALNATIAKKKLEEQEKQIRELIIFAYGKETYIDMIQMRKDIRSRREKAIYNQRRRKQKLSNFIALILAIIFSGGIITATVMFIQEASNG